MAIQLAQSLRKGYKVEDVRVHIYMPVGYNNREATLLLDPKVNLANTSIPASWLISVCPKISQIVEKHQVFCCLQG